MLPDAEQKLASPRWRAFAELCTEIGGLPRHISQHPGGMVISTRPLVELVPVQPAAMAGRQMCQWDKDSCADAGFLKIDLLGLGMLSAVEECVDTIARTRGEKIDLSRIPLDDPDVFAEIQAADTVGCFQIESRAQMQTILRTRPENLDDITIQVALVRPGPIQGKAVHPYIERRQKLREDPSYEPPADHPLLEEAAARDARRRRLPGSGARRRHPSRRLHHRRGGGTAARDEPQALARGARVVPRALRRRCARERRRRRHREHGVRQARRVLRLRLPEVALGRVRAARVPVGVAASSLLPRVPCCAAQCAADGLLSAGDARPRRPAPRRRDAAPGREPQRGRLHDRGRRRARRAQVRAGRGGGRCGGSRERSSLRLRPRARAADPALRRRAAGTGRVGRVRLLRPAAARAPVAARPRAARADGAGLGRRGEAARASARSDGGDARSPGAVDVGESARRLPHDEPLDRRPPGRAHAPAPAAGNDLERRAARPAEPFQRRRWRGWSSPASVPRPPTASSSCSSRTSSRRSTSSSCRRSTTASAASSAASRCSSPAAASSRSTATGTSSSTSSSRSRPLARELTEGADVHGSLPAAHHFGHR